jgi:curved DNA-binding protein
MDYYKTLGVERSASPDEIKKAYRKMAAKHHPDRGGNKEDFQKVEEAYRNLSDPNLKQQHDNPNPFGDSNPFGGGGFHFNFGGGNPFDDIFQHFHRQHQQQQRIYTVAVAVTLEQVARGSTETIQVGTPHGVKTFQIKVPQSVEHGQRIRYDGLMTDGVLQVEFRILPHQTYERRGLDLYSKIEVSIYDLLLGTSVRFKTIWGTEMDVNIPPKLKPGSTMRMAGHGLVHSTMKGNQFLLIEATMPDTISPELTSLLEQERNKGKQ